MKKLIKLGFICALLLVGGCSSNEPAKESDNTAETTTLHIEVKDEVNDKELYNGDVSVEGTVETLYDFLDKAEELQIVVEDGSYGKTLMGMMGVETEDFNKGPWWLYESENNDACQAAGYCDAISSLKIEDGDHFTFRYTDQY